VFDRSAIGKKRTIWATLLRISCLTLGNFTKNNAFVGRFAQIAEIYKY